MPLEIGTEVVGEAEGSSMNPAIQAEKVLEKARTKGWKPLEEFEGDPADWIDHKEFVAREPLYNKIHDLKGQISRQSQKFDQDMQVISKEFTKMSEVAYKKAVAELKADRALAIRDQDVDAVEAIDEQIVDIEKERVVAQTTARQPQAATETPEMTRWKSDNSAWFEKDREMTDDAIEIGVGYLARHQGRKTQAEMLEHVANKIRTIYPEKFGGKAKVQPKAPAVESQGSQSQPAPKAGQKGKLTVADLDDDERQVMKTLIQKNVLKDVAAKNKRSQQEEYLAQLSDAKAR